MVNSFFTFDYLVIIKILFIFYLLLYSGIKWKKTLLKLFDEMDQLLLVSLLFTICIPRPTYFAVHSESRANYIILGIYLLEILFTIVFFFLKYFFSSYIKLFYSTPRP